MSTYFYTLIYQLTNLQESCKVDTSWPPPHLQQLQPCFESETEIPALTLRWNLNFPQLDLEAETPDPVTAETDLRRLGTPDTKLTDVWSPVCAQ